MKDNHWFAIAWPTMLTLVKKREPIFRLQCHFYQAHVIFLAQCIKRHNCAENGSSFYTDQDSSMHTTGEYDPIG